MYLNIYVSKDEYHYIKSKQRGFVRSLVVESMKGNKDNTIIKPINNKNEIKKAIKQKPIDNPYVCSKCNNVLVANKCINKQCH
jgi:hypothetical protein